MATTRRELLRTALGTTALALPGCRLLGVSPCRPNVVLILVDDLGSADLGCCGSGYHETPHLDRLAAEGLRFTQGYAAAAVCSPTRAAVLTGRHPARLGITDWIRAGFQGGKVPPDRKNPDGYEEAPGRALACPANRSWLELEEETLAELLGGAGYATAHVGKWHLGFPGWYPEDQGFGLNVGGCDRGQPPTYFDPYVHPEEAPGGLPGLPPRVTGEHLTDREADEAAAFIRRHRDRPFFLYYAPYAVHTPIQGRADLVAKYRAKRPAVQKNPVYAALVEGVDRAVGTILAAVAEIGAERQTLVVFTSDNGGLLPVTSNHPLRSGKGFPYEGGTRVPLIWRWPGVTAPGGTCAVPAGSWDLLPTICDAAGVAPPAGRELDGESLAPLLGGGRPPARESLFWHFPHYRGRDAGPWSSLRRGGWKLIRHYDGGRRELYHLDADPAERLDLAGREAGRVRSLERELDERLAAVGARLPRPAG